MASSIPQPGSPTNSSRETNQARSQPDTTFLSRTLHRVSSYLPDCGTSTCLCYGHQANSDSSEMGGFAIASRQHGPVTRQVRLAESTTSFIPFHERTPAELLGDSLFDFETIQAIRTYVEEFRKNILSALKYFNIDDSSEFLVYIQLAEAQLEQHYIKESPQIQLYTLTCAAEVVSDLRYDTKSLLSEIPKDQHEHLHTIKGCLRKTSQELADKYIKQCNKEYHRLGISVDGKTDELGVISEHNLRQFQNQFIKQLKQKPDDPEYTHYSHHLEPLTKTEKNTDSDEKIDDQKKETAKYKLPKSFMENFENRPIANQIKLINDAGTCVVNLTESTRPRGFQQQDLGIVLRTLESFTTHNQAMIEAVCQYLTQMTTMTMRVFGQYLLQHTFGKETKLDVQGQLTTFKVRHANNGSGSSDSSDTTSVEIEVKLTGQPGGLRVDSFIEPLVMSQYNQLRKLMINMECKLTITSQDSDNPIISPLSVISQWQQAPRTQYADISHLSVHGATTQ